MTKETLEARIAKLEARVQELEDERAIRELLSRYGYNADCCRDEEYIALYTEDGVMDLSAGGRHFQGIVRWEGKKKLWEFLTDPEGHHSPDFYGNGMHVQGNNVVTHIHGDEAVVNSYSIVLQGNGPETRLLSAGNNQWRLKRVDGNWLLKERRRRQIGDSEYITNLDATPE